MLSPWHREVNNAAPPFDKRPRYQSGGGQNFADLLQRASFILPLGDAGAGAVSTTITIGPGAASFTRATVKWTKLASGLWASVASGTACAGYTGWDTAVGSYGGFFHEPAGIQLVTPDASVRDMTDASWVKGATMTVVKDGIGIDGAANSCSRLTGGAVSATNTAFQTLTAAASSRSYSVWLKRVTGTGTINITQDGGSTYTDVTASLNTSTFTRVLLTASVLNAAFGIQVVTSTDVILADFNQFEPGTVGSSPMATAGAARNDDLFTVNTAFPFPCALYAEFAVNNSLAVNPIFVELNDATTNERYGLFQNTGTTLGAYVVDGGASLVTANVAGSLVVNTIYKGAASFNVNDVTAARSGILSATDTSVTEPTVTRIQLGSRSDAAAALHGFVKNIRVLRPDQSGSALQAITS